MNLELLVLYGPVLLKAFLLTCGLALLGNLGALLLGCLMAVFKMENLMPKGNPLGKFLKRLSQCWIELFRNVPLLLQVLFCYYVFNLNGFLATIIGLWLYTSAFMAETFRAGFMTVPVEEIRESKLLGLKPYQQLWYVYLPRSLENNLSALASQVMNLIKNTSIGYFVALSEMTFTFETLAGQTYQFIEFFAVTLVAYSGLCLGVSYGARKMEKALTRRFQEIPVALSHRVSGEAYAVTSE